jgi:hypothetical protein
MRRRTRHVVDDADEDPTELLFHELYCVGWAIQHAEDFLGAHPDLREAVYAFKANGGTDSDKLREWLLHGGPRPESPPRLVWVNPAR